MLKVHFVYLNDHFSDPFMQGLISTSHSISTNPRGALYALANCPCLIVVPRGVVQLAFCTCGVWSISGISTTGLLLVHRLAVGISSVSIFPSLLKSPQEYIGASGWIYSLSIFWL